MFIALNLRTAELLRSANVKTPDWSEQASDEDTACDRVLQTRCNGPLVFV